MFAPPLFKLDTLVPGLNYLDALWQIRISAVAFSFGYLSVSQGAKCISCTFVAEYTIPSKVIVIDSAKSKAEKTTFQAVMWYPFATI